MRWKHVLRNLGNENAFGTTFYDTSSNSTKAMDFWSSGSFIYQAFKFLRAFLETLR